VRLYWEPDEIADHFIGVIRDTVLVNLPRADSIADADAIVYPFDATATIKGRYKLARSAMAARRAKKPLVAFAVVDSTSKIAVPGSIVFRTSMNRSTAAKNEFLLPYLWESYESQVPYRSREREDEPTIGFCGLGDDRRKPWLDALQNQVKCNFIVRPSFWGGSPHDPKLIQDFFTNIIDTDITFAMRGYGNFSMRFYQVLSCGRIPLWVDTDTVLPYGGLEDIPWDRISIRLPQGPTSVAKRAIQTFWESVGDYKDLQQQIASLHKQLFTPNGFAEHLSRHADRYLNAA
jgi:hypothetical protein